MGRTATIFLTIVGLSSVAFSQQFQPNPDGSFYLSGIAIHNSQDPLNPIAAAVNGKFVLSDQPNEDGQWNSRPNYRLESNPNVRMVNWGAGWMLVAWGSPDGELANWGEGSPYDLFSDDNVEYPWQSTFWTGEGLVSTNWDVTEIGGGHNGLLARTSHFP